MDWVQAGGSWRSNNDLEQSRGLASTVSGAGLELRPGRGLWRWRGVQFKSMALERLIVGLVAYGSSGVLWEERFLRRRAICIRNAAVLAR